MLKKVMRLDEVAITELFNVSVNDAVLVLNDANSKRVI